MKITKKQLRRIIKEEIGALKKQDSQGGAQYEVMRQLGLFHAELIKLGHNELADNLDRILVQAQDAGMTGSGGR